MFIYTLDGSSFDGQDFGIGAGLLFLVVAPIYLFIIVGLFIFRYVERQNRVKVFAIIYFLTVLFYLAYVKVLPAIVETWNDSTILPANIKCHIYNKDECLYNYATKFNNINDCKKISNDSSYKINCYRKLVAKNNDFALCGDFDLCYDYAHFDLVIKRTKGLSEKIDHCNKINELNLKNRCNDVLASGVYDFIKRGNLIKEEDVVICELTTIDQHKASCYRSFANFFNNKSLCSSIPNRYDSDRQQCMKGK